MKLEELITEMPWHKPTDLSIEGIPAEDQSYSVEEFQMMFDILVNRPAGQQHMMVGLAKDHSKAIAGIIEGESIYTRCILEFQSVEFEHEIEGPCLQVDLVQAEANQQGTGFGYEIYKAVLAAGYALISDYVQYNGGRKLWEKIIRRAGQDGHHVLVMRNGEIMTQRNGAPIKFNGNNIPVDQVWGGRDRQDTLLVALNNDRRIVR